MEAKIIAVPDQTAFTARGCVLMKEALQHAIDEHGRAILGLSGGSTPRPIYEALGKGKGIDWSKVWVFLVDDRCIRPDDPKSNQFLLRSTLLKHAPVPESQLIFPDTSLLHQQCADVYDRHLKDLLKKGPADLVTLGMGNDGHIASLFPPLDNSAFGPQHAIATTTDHFDVRDRISVTMPILTSARSKLFLLKGEAKKKVWEEMMESDDGEKRWPATGVIESGGVTVIAQ